MSCLHIQVGQHALETAVHHFKSKSAQEPKMCWMIISPGAHRAKEAERAGHQDPDEQHYHNGAKGHGRQGVVGDGHSVEHRGDAEAHEREQVGCQQHGGDPGLAAIARIEAAAAGKQRGDTQMANSQP